MNLEAVYPDADNLSEEMSFEELRAEARGWLRRDWTMEQRRSIQSIFSSPESRITESGDTQPSPHSPLVTEQNDLKLKDDKVGRPKKMKIMEVKSATQTG